ncbi:ABC transporter substrate-binding protein [Desulfosporosinus sp.]|uniref:ABC transporter substrate-binding protein n=1 Tax=Desulfosporosinus sp. TaxID=157907 RepID=UPI000E8DCC30|nr:ABC transporter substrate-binding protein [Desulfosporosinus sp.]MBC2727089.1 ABC transporter substrate-binding protein [Desulfosporosinus sp.]HBV88566.1 branched-chain amino acid ABC transporter substrate-binding protein [Desulfosporosinus sp.]
MKKFTKLGSIFLVMLLVVTLFASGCGQKSSSDGDSKVLTVGVDLPLTGPSAKAGQEFKDTVTMAFDEVGNKIGDYNVKLVWIDDGADPQKGTSAYEQAVVRDKIDVGILNWNSSVAVALMETVAKYQIPHYFGMGAAGTINEKWASDPKYHYWINKGWAMPDKMTQAYVDVVSQAIEKGQWSPRNKKLAIYGDDTDWGRSYGASMKKRFTDAGWQVVNEEYTKLGETDMYPLIAKMKSLDVSLVAGTISSPPSIAAFIKQSREQNLKALMISDALGETAGFYSLTGNASDYILDNRPVFTTDKALKFAADFKAKYGYDPSPAAGGQVYDYTRFFIKCANETLKEHGKLDKETLFKFSQEKLMTGQITFTDGVVIPEYKFDKTSAPDPVVGEKNYIFPVVQYFEGKATVVWPDAQKVGDLKIPDYAK